MNEPLLFPGLYEVRQEEAAPFGDHWCGPDRFEPWEEMLVATYAGEGDGQSTEVYCTAAPARFYRVKALPGVNSVGEPKEPYECSTGSSAARLAADIAEAIAGGMLGFEQTTQD